MRRVKVPLLLALLAVPGCTLSWFLWNLYLTHRIEALIERHAIESQDAGELIQNASWLREHVPAGYRVSSVLRRRDGALVVVFVPED